MDTYVTSLQRRHNKSDSVSNPRLLDCWPNRLFRCRSKKTSKLCVIGLCEGNPPVTGNSIESHSMVDLQWNILYWKSKWNLHAVCWCAVGCEWGTTSVYFGITYVCFIPCKLPVFVVEPQYQHRDFLYIFVKSIMWRTHTQSSKNSCWFKIWMRFVGPILITLGASSIWGFL